MNLFQKLWKKYPYEIILGSISFLLFFWQITRSPFLDPDCYLWLEKVRHIYLHDSWLTYPVHFGKPPLFIWWHAIWVKLLGWRWLAIAIPYQLTSLAYIGLTYLASKQFFDRKTAFWSALILLTSINFVQVRFAFNMDTLAACFILLSFYFYGRFRNRFQIQDWLWVLVCAFLAWYSKSPYGFLILPVVFLVEFKNKVFWRFIVKHWWQQFLVIIACLAIIAPWVWGQVHAHGTQVIDRMLIDQVGRLFFQHGRANLARDNNFWRYPLFLILIMLPWSLYLITHLKTAWQQAKRSLPDRIIGYWILVPLIIFSLSGELKIPRYILFAYPAVAILITRIIFQVKSSTVHRWLFLFLANFLALALTLFTKSNLQDDLLLTQIHIPLLAPFLITLIFCLLIFSYLFWNYRGESFLKRSTPMALIPLVVLLISAQFFIQIPYPRLQAAQSIQSPIPFGAKRALYVVPTYSKTARHIKQWQEFRFTELMLENYQRLDQLTPKTLKPFSYLIVAHMPNSKNLNIPGKKMKTVSFNFYNGGGDVKNYSKVFDTWTYTLYQL